MAAPEGYKALGKIGISYKGEYASNTAYERLDAVYHNGSTYLAIKDAPDGAPRDDKINWIYLAKGFNSDIGDSEITFTQASIRENIDTGESVRTVFGKIKKFFADLTAPAFAQMITTKDDLLATKATGYVPDAKAVADAVTDVNSNLQPKTLYIPILSDYIVFGDTLPLIVSGRVAQISIPTLKNIVNGDNVICSAGSIPAEYRPSANKSFTTLASNGGTYTRYIITILADGSIGVYNYGSYSEAENFSDTFTYICNG